MTLVLLALAWFGLALLVARPESRLPGIIGPRIQAVAAFATVLCLTLIPLAAVAVILAGALESVGGSGFARCGKLLAAIWSDPLARPEITGALLLLSTVPVRVAQGVVAAWRSQRHAARLARSSSGPLVVVPSHEPVAFTAGLVRPRVVVSEALLDEVSPEFGRVVLAHEDAHRRGRHPLLLFVVESLAHALPLPQIQQAADAFRLALETAADERAVRIVGSRALVAEAVASVALGSAHALGFEGHEVSRVRRLLEPPSVRRGLGAAVLFVGVLGAAVFAGAHAVHCVSESAEALQVVQCRTNQPD